MGIKNQRMKKSWRILFVKKNLYRRGHMEWIPPNADVTSINIKNSLRNKDIYPFNVKHIFLTSYTLLLRNVVKKISASQK